MCVCVDMNGIAPFPNGLVSRRATSLPVGVDDREARQHAATDRRGRLADALHRPLAGERMRVHARSGGPPLALDRELRLVGVVADEVELLEPRLEPELAKRRSDGLGSLSRSLAARGARADAGREGVDEVHVPSLRPTGHRANARQ